MKKETLSRVAIGTVGVIAGLGAGLAGIASAQSLGPAGSTGGTTGSDTAASSTHQGLHRGFGMMDHDMHGRGMGHGVMGTVTAVSGDTITVTGKDGASYTIDASKASIGKVVSITATDVKVGDTLGIEGTVSGTSVSATHIMDGIPPFGDKSGKQSNQ